MPTAYERAEAVEIAQRAITERKITVRSLQPLRVSDWEDFWVISFKRDEPEGARSLPGTVAIEIDKSTGTWTVRLGK